MTRPLKRNVFKIIGLTFSGIICWIFIQYLRTGHLRYYVWPPSFKDRPANTELMLANLRSYDSFDEVENKIKDAKMFITKVSNEDLGLFRGVNFIISRYKLENFKIGSINTVAHIEFYNNRLSRITICSHKGAEDLFREIKDFTDLAVNRYKSIKRNNLLVSYSGQKNDCIHWSDSRLIDEFQVWDDLNR